METVRYPYLFDSNIVDLTVSDKYVVRFEILG